MNSQFIHVVFTIFLSFINCDSIPNKVPTSDSITVQNTKETDPNNFNDYWFSGTAELNSYHLKQARYGEIRDGEVVLVFVTEPFSASKQVKLDNPKKTPNDAVTVMKLNNIRKFNTGIYDYSILTSTFTPINTKDHPNTLKATTSIQEWCGVTFTQLNLNADSYHYKSFSYFESEGDVDKKISKALLEDELLTRIRINNGLLPEGEVDLIPSVLQSRFAHQDIKPTKAIIVKNTTEKRIQYNIEIRSQNRTLTIDVESKFPYKILAWTEQQANGLTTTATLKKSLRSPYWKQKSLADENLRKKLLLIK